MTNGECFPLYLPAEARRMFGSEAHARRIARPGQWKEGSRLLELCGGPTGRYLARALGCKVATAEHPQGTLPFPDAEFDGILAVGAMPFPAGIAVRSLRKYLAPQGRLVITYPVKVGQRPLKLAVDFWEKLLGEPLLLPRELAEVFEKEGYEPETIEILDELALDDYYRELEPLLTKQPAEAKKGVDLLGEVIALHGQASRGSVTFALVAGRRKEPGEKPPPSRDGG